MTPEEISAEHTRRYFAGVPEAELSSWYHEEHQKLIDERHKAEKEANRTLIYCELCRDELPPQRGRPAKRCETCKQ